MTVIKDIYNIIKAKVIESALSLGMYFPVNKLCKIICF